MKIYCEKDVVTSVIKQEIGQQKSKDLIDFLHNMNKLESFAKINAVDYVKNIRKNSRLV